MSGVEKREWKVVSREGGATEGLINHSCIVIDFLLKGVSQTLNYVHACVCRCVCVCAVQYSLRAQSHQLHSQASQRLGSVAGVVALTTFFSRSQHVATTFRQLACIFSTITVKGLIIHIL